MEPGREAPVLARFGQLRRLHPVAPGEVGDGAGGAEKCRRRAGCKAQAIIGGVEELLAHGVEPAVPRECGGPQEGIESALGAFLLALSGLVDPFGHLMAPFPWQASQLG